MKLISPWYQNFYCPLELMQGGLEGRACTQRSCLDKGGVANCDQEGGEEGATASQKKSEKEEKKLVCFLMDTLICQKMSDRLSLWTSLDLVSMSRLLSLGL